MMVSQGDIALLQRITQPEAQSQSLSNSAGLACGRQRKGRSGAAAPCTLHWNWASFQGETGFWAHPGLAGSFVMKMQMKVQTLTFLF